MSLRRSAPLLLLGAVPVCAPGVRAQGDPVEKNWKAVCQAATAHPVQVPKMAGPLSPAQLPGCDGEELYYGNGVRKPDYAAALQCGWYQRAHPNPTRGDMFLGPGVLTMLYANGYGVPRSEDLAIRFACEDPWTAVAENEGRIGHLEAMRDGKDSKKFDLCDDATSGLSMGACQRIDNLEHAGSRNAKIAAAIADLPPAAKQLFPALQAAEEAFANERAGDEVDMSGTARGMFYGQEMNTLSDQFLINLQRFRKGDVPPATTQDLRTLDAKLNTAYRALMAAPASKWQFGTVKPDGIRMTERAWLNLVDAWVKFGRVAYPDLSETRLRAQLIRLRLHQLRSVTAN